MAFNDLIRRELSKFLSTEAIDALETDIQNIATGEIAAGAVSLAKLATGCKPVLLPIAAGIKTSTREDNIAGLSSAIALANAAKAKYNLHLASGGTGLATVIALANDCKSKWNAHLAAGGTALSALCAWANALAADYTAHIADATEHKLADAVNVITALTATNHATLYLLVKDILDQYAAHNADSEAAGALTYHYAQNTATHVLASVAAPTSLALAITRLTDAKAKYNAHDNDTAAHGAYGVNQDTTVAVAIGTEVHPTAVDATNATAAANATNLASAITLITELLTDYDTHEGDSELAADWVYHKAQEAGDHSLASAAAPTSLAECITRINDWKAKYNAHAADTTTHGSAGTAVAVADAAVGAGEHPSQADTTNVITSADATNLATLITLVTEMLTDYDAHEGDGELASAWLYHEAQEGGDCSLASASAPTTLALCITRLNDFKAKYNTHDADATSHTTGSTQQISTSDAAYGATNRVSISGALASDIVMFSILNDGTGNVTGVGGTAGTDYVDFEFSADPQNDCIYGYSVFRTAS